MKKFLSIAAAIICVAASFSSCKKDVVAAQYKFEKSELLELQCKDSATGEKFFTELGEVNQRFANTEFSDNDLIVSYTEVVNKYDNGVIAGTFSLYKAEGTSQNFRPIHTWTMKFAVN